MSHNTGDQIKLTQYARHKIGGFAQTWDIMIYYTFIIPKFTPGLSKTCSSLCNHAVKHIPTSSSGPFPTILADHSLLIPSASCGQPIRHQPQ